jgi:autotransporter-associated beta strand protein
MKTTINLVGVLVGLSHATSQAATVLYSENFNGEGTASTAYNDGTNPEVNVGSIGTLQSTGSNQGGNAGDTAWRFNAGSVINGGNGLRFGTGHNWATGANSAAILAAGGFSIAFDFDLAGNGVATDWFSVRVGSGGENSGVNFVGVDFAALIRGNGQVTTFEDGAQSDFGTATVGAPRSVVFSYAFDSWNAATTVNFTGFVDGSKVATDSFTWNSTNDVKVVFGGRVTGSLVDNIYVGTTATTFNWDANSTAAGTGGTGNWSNGTTNNTWNTGTLSSGWQSGSLNSHWQSTGTQSKAVFGGAAGTVTIDAGGVAANALTFETTGYEVTGGTLTLNGTTPTVTTNTGVDATISSVIAGSAGLVKAGSGTLTLSGVNTYTGATTISNGTLIVGDGTSGSLGNTAVTVASGATLGGSGTIGGATTVQGTHNAGNADVSSGVGSQAFSSDLTYATGSIFEWDLNASSIASGFDTVSAAGNISVESDAIFKVILGATALADIMNAGNTFWNTPFGTQDWAMSDIFGAAFASGAFSSVETSTDVSSYGSFSITGTSLTWTAVPEPSSALAGILLGLGLLHRRRPACGH